MLNIYHILSLFLTYINPAPVIKQPDISQINTLFHVSVADFNNGTINSQYGVHLIDKALMNNVATRIFVFKNTKETIISFEGTGLENNEYNNAVVKMNEILKLGFIPPSYEQALDYTRKYIKDHPKEDIWLTGISAGGSQAEYVSQNTGKPGMSFAGTGIPIINPFIHPTNFWCFVNNHDPVGTFAMDTENRLGSLQINHYGQVIYLNNLERTGPTYNIIYSSIKHNGNFLYNHMPEQYEQALYNKYGKKIILDKN